MDGVSVEEYKKLEEANQKLQTELTQVKQQADAEIKLLQSQNQALSKKVQRLALQKTELQHENDSFKRDNWDLKFKTMNLEGQAQVHQLDRRHDKEVTAKLTAQLQQTTSSFESKLEGLKKKAAKLVVNLVGHRHGPSRIPILDAKANVDSPAEEVKRLETTSYDNPEVQEQILTILSSYFNDDFNEEQAAKALSQLPFDISEKIVIPAIEPAVNPAPEVKEQIDNEPVLEKVTADETFTESVLESRPELPQTGSSARVLFEPSTQPQWSYVTQFVLNDPSKMQRLLSRAKSMRNTPENLASNMKLPAATSLASHDYGSNFSFRSQESALHSAAKKLLNLSSLGNSSFGAGKPLAEIPNTVESRIPNAPKPKGSARTINFSTTPAAKEPQQATFKFLPGNASTTEPVHGRGFQIDMHDGLDDKFASKSRDIQKF